MRYVVYLMSGPAHVPYLAVSLMTLRKWWDGPVIVTAWPESMPYVSRLMREDQLAISAVERTPEYRGKNDQFIDKIRLIRQGMPDDTLLYLDADTTIHGHLDRLFDAAEMYGFAATQFCNWMANCGIARGRIETLREFAGIPPVWIDKATTEDWPSVNGGVFAAMPNSVVLETWLEWTLLAQSTFIADEKVLHILQTKYVPLDEMTVLRGGQWNCSVVEKFHPPYLKAQDVIVRHYHGDSNVRRPKSPSGYQQWGYLFNRALAQDLGGIRGWWRDCGNRWMKDWKYEPESGSQPTGVSEPAGV